MPPTPTVFSSFMAFYHALPEFGALISTTFLLKQRQDLSDYVLALPEGTKKNAGGDVGSRPGGKRTGPIKR